MNRQEQAISHLSSAMSSLARAIIGLTEEVRKIKAEQFLSLERIHELENRVIELDKQINGSQGEKS